MNKRQQLIAAAKPLAMALILFATLTRAGVASAGPSMIIDDGMIAVWRGVAKDRNSAVGRAVARCADIAARPSEFERDAYMGLDWAQYLQACLVAWVATGDERFAKTSIRYATALIDDLQKVGDKLGGNEAARRDSGFSIRALGPNTALAYDWLYDHPLLTKELKARMRERLWAWVDWYRKSGYRARAPGNNYHAGYVAAATLAYAAIERDLTAAEKAQWAFVRSEIWDTDMKAALAPGGVLEGGDWPEGWQYGPLAVANYALAGRALAHRGYEMPGFTAWAQALMPRFLHGLTPGGMMFAGGDTQSETPSLAANLLVPAALMIAAPNGEAAQQARNVIIGKKLVFREFPLFEALTEAIVADPSKVATIGRNYYARGSGTYYARTLVGRQEAEAVWLAMQCSRTLDVDHRPPNAGNFVIARGRDEVLIDPTPYGSLSSLTSNAPTIESPQLPDNYRPSQAFWGKASGLRTMLQTASGAVALRCEYADQYAFQERPSDVKMATREVALIPYDGGKSAAVFVFDEAQAPTSRQFHLRFRSLGRFAQVGTSYVAPVGASQLGVYPVGFVSAKPAKTDARSLPKGDCFQDGVARGACDASRFPAHEYRTQLSGTRMVAGHVLDVTAATTRPGVPTSLMITGGGGSGDVEGWALARGGETLFAARSRGKTGFSLVLPKGLARGALLLASPMAVEVVGSLKGENCHVEVKLSPGNGKTNRLALVLNVDRTCLALIEHPDAASDLVAGLVADEGAAVPTPGEVPRDPEVHRMDRELQELPQGVTHQGGPAPMPTVMPKRGCAASVGAGEVSLLAMALVLLAMYLRRYR